jgi:hypothetical protein
MIDLAPQALSDISKLENAESSMLEVVKKGKKASKEGAMERLQSIKEYLKLLKLFSNMADKKIAREAARLAGEIRRAVSLYGSAAQNETPDAATATNEVNATSGKSVAASVKEMESFAQEAEAALKIARHIIEEYIAKRPKDKENKGLRKELTEAEYAITNLKARTIAESMKSSSSDSASEVNGIMTYSNLQINVMAGNQACNASAISNPVVA